MRLKEGEEEREERVGLVIGKGWNQVEMVSSGTTKEALSQLYCSFLKAANFNSSRKGKAFHVSLAERTRG